MSETSIQEIVIHAAKKDPVKVGDAFKAAMDDKLSELLAAKRTEIAKGLFNEPAEAEPTE